MSGHKLVSWSSNIRFDSVSTNSGELLSQEYPSCKQKINSVKQSIYFIPNIPISTEYIGLYH